MTDVAYRRAAREDALAVADLHADSWSRHYRGAYTDAFLDGPVIEDRRSVWRSRLEHDDGTARTIVAEHAGELVGFVHLIFDADPVWGALVDNLHVHADHQRRGIGRALLVRAADAVARVRPASPIHLWVLTQNVDAQAFYRALGGRPEDRRDSEPPGGGRITGIRIVWPDPRCLIES